MKQPHDQDEGPLDERNDVARGPVRADGSRELPRPGTRAHRTQLLLLTRAAEREQEIATLRAENHRLGRRIDRLEQALELQRAAARIMGRLQSLDRRV